MDNGQTNEAQETAEAKVPNIKNALFSKVVDEANTIILSLLQNGGKLTPTLEKYCEAQECPLPHMADAYGYLQDRLKMEIGFWALWGLGPEDEEKMVLSVRKVHDSLMRKIETSMNNINLKELKGDQYIWTINDYGKIEIGVAPREEKAKEEMNG